METKEELNQLEIALRSTPAPEADKVCMINAIHALLEGVELINGKAAE